MTAQVIISLRVGADLVAEPFDLSSVTFREAICHGAGVGIDGGLDGGLDIIADGARVSWPDVWDRVDGMLAAWLSALDRVAAGSAEATAVFPDTRVECVVSRVDDSRVRIEYEDVRATVAIAPLTIALEAAAARLLKVASAAGASTPALAILAARTEAR